MNEQILMGGGLALISCWGLFNVNWFSENSRYGRQLTVWFGPEGGTRVLQGLMLSGLLLGTLLATNVIQPIRWESSSGSEATAAE